MSQRRWRLQALVQACSKAEYEGDIFDKGRYHIAPQIISDHSFEGNWWYIWFRGLMIFTSIEIIKEAAFS